MAANITYFLFILTAAVSGDALFDAYILVLSGSNEVVGVVESAVGVAVLLFAFPIGWAGDRWAKHNVLRLNILIGIAAGLLLWLGTYLDAIPILTCAAVTWAIHSQFVFALLPAVIAEGTKAGAQRTAAMTSQQTAMSLGYASGPLVQLIALALSPNGGAWTRQELHLALSIGIIPFSAYVVMLLYLTHLHKLMAPASAGDAESPQNSGLVSTVTSMWTWFAAGWCEVVCFVTAIGSGMTFKFWPLFFKQDFGFSPLGVCIMQLAIWLGIALTTMFVVPRMLVHCSRLSTANLLQVGATGMLFAIAKLPHLGVALEVCLVVGRNALMNGASPLVQATILDLVPRQHRGKWSSFASLSRMTWSGSAFVGGVLSDEHDYRYAFFITACVHTCSSLLLVLLNMLTCCRKAEPPLGEDDDES